MAQGALLKPSMEKGSFVWPNEMGYAVQKKCNDDSLVHLVYSGGKPYPSVYPVTFHGLRNIKINDGFFGNFGQSQVISGHLFLIS